MPQKCCADDLDAEALYVGIDPVYAPGHNASIQLKSLKVGESMAAPHDVAEEDIIECIYETIPGADDSDDEEYVGVDPYTPGPIQLKSLKVDESMAVPHDVAEEDMIECIYDDTVSKGRLSG